MTGTDTDLLVVDDLTVDLGGPDAQPRLLDGVSFSVPANRTVALIGESGCGKTMTAMAVLGLLPAAVRIVGGRIGFGAVDLLTAARRERRRVLGKEIGAVFQNPMTSLNPTMRIGPQIVEARRLHLKESEATSKQRAIDLMDQVGIPEPRARFSAYPHELSGGMQQRVMIAMAIACEPRLLVADEPTTALDVTIQAEVLDLLRRLREELGMGVLLVTHDLGVVADFADDVVVMYAGQIIEHTSVERLFDSVAHPYSAALLGAMPQAGAPRTTLQAIPGRVPPAGTFPIGCRFATRCDHVKQGVCDREEVTMGSVDPGHTTRCVRLLDGSLERAAVSPARPPIGVDA